MGILRPAVIGGMENGESSRIMIGAIIKIALVSPIIWVHTPMSQCISLAWPIGLNMAPTASSLSRCSAHGGTMAKEFLSVIVRNGQSPVSLRSAHLDATAAAQVQAPLARKVTRTAAGLMPNSETEHNLAPASYSFQATYSRDANYVGWTSPFEPLGVEKESRRPTHLSFSLAHSYAAFT